MVSGKINMETARAEMIEYTFKELVIVFNQELQVEYGARYDRFAGWIKKGLILGRFLEYVRRN
ncbi:hypothetical protein LCGC14_1671660 [marine sediment metagenome]|uniref:Uncharacterized protein n=1 Tax=marine sediment metagenome TaxID=412755 RepID=A0A0F9K6X9_9ZZZZ